MKIAIPLVDCKLAAHFGHCSYFAIFDVDQTSGEILRRQDILAPPCEPGMLPSLLVKNGVDIVLAGGMGQRAMDLLTENKIAVVTGVERNTPENILSAYFLNKLQTSANPCAH